MADSISSALAPIKREPRRYAIFISYRHADNLEMGRKWATWLHEAAENYEIPPDLIGKQNGRAESVPASLYPVFRDEEELPADADLSQNIQRALENSNLLVVICSPRAVQSRFVADEIRYFKELGKSSRILALMIDGEPNASDDPSKIDANGQSPECFPEPLRFGVPDENGKIDWTARTEPIAADCRPAGQPIQGWTTAAAYYASLESQPGLTKAQRQEATREYAERLELAKLKVIAGALGLPLGELTQRDKARQLRRAKQRSRLLLTLSAVFGLLAAAAAVLGWVANEKRKDADVQRREAETQKIEADRQRQQAIAQRSAADQARAAADREKRQAIATLATSDFQEGTNRLRESTTARSGMAYLARAAEAGNASAATRIWTLFQQRSFWLPSSDPLPPPAPARQHLQEMIPPPAFEKVELNGELIAPTYYASSSDGTRCIVIVSTMIAGEGGHLTFRAFETSGRPLGPWREIPYDGDYYLSSIDSAILSSDGRFAAILATPWRVSQFLEIWDIDQGRRLGEPITAEGNMPNEQSGTFNDVWFTDQKDDSTGPFLITLSSRGNARLHRIDASSDESSIEPKVTHSHLQSANQAQVSIEDNRFVSASIDGTVLVSESIYGEPIGWPIPVNDTVEALRIDSPELLTIGLTGGKSVIWKLQPPSIQSPPEVDLQMGNTAGLHRDWGGDPDVPVPATIVVDQIGNLKLQLTHQTELQVIDENGNIAWSHRFRSPIAHARFRNDQLVIAQTDFFVTEVWNTKSNSLQFPAIDETTLFTQYTAGGNVLLSSISPDHKFLLTRSFQHEPPNIGYYYFTVWDTASGKPVTDRITCTEDSAVEENSPLAQNHAEFSADGTTLFIANSTNGVLSKPLAQIQLRPTPENLPKIPDLGHLLGGLRVTAEGTLIPAP